MKRFVGLDGIKGLALIAIVLYHCMQQRLPGGFYGVDVFFTVSGFLIAVSLIRSLAKTGSLNLVRYIPKRAVRLYPALFLLIPVIVSVGWLFDHDILVSIRDQVITARIQFVSATLVFGLAAFDCSLAISSSHTSLGVL